MCTNLCIIVYQRRDRRVCPWRGRLHRPVRLRRGQRQPHGAAHHDQRLQDRLRREGQRRHPLFPLRKTGQEGQGGRYVGTFWDRMEKVFRKK